VDKKTDDTLKLIPSVVAPYGFFSPNWIEHKNITNSLRAKKQGRQTMSSPECHKGNERKKKQKQKK
jgi:hypothetical protein